MNDVINEFDKVLEWARAEYHTDAFIAGGAVRDYILEAPIKDIDVYAPHDWRGSLEAHKGGIPGTSGGGRGVVNVLTNLDVGATYRADAILMTPTYFPVGGVPFQILKEFDITLCSIAYIGRDRSPTTGGFIFTEEFQEALVTGVVKVYTNATEDHLNRVRSKHPQFTYRKVPQCSY